MMKLFSQGGPLFMSLLSIVLVGMVVYAFYISRSLSARSKSDIGLIKALGLFALVLGVLGQMIGLYTAFAVMENNPITQQILAGGLRVSMITTMYGLVIYLIALAVHEWIRRRWQHLQSSDQSI